MNWKTLPILLITLIIAACTPQETQQQILVSLVADDSVQTYSLPEPITVGQFLRDAEIELEPLDRVNPSLVTQINDGMRVTVVRVTEQTECEETEIAYQQVFRELEGMTEEQQIGQPGENGIEEVCYRTTIVDGEPGERVEIRRNVTTPPQDEIIYIQPRTELEPRPINGTLAYISNGNAWIMRGSNTARTPLTETGNLDERVFSLSSDGRQLIYTTTTDDEEVFNQLWLISDTTVPSPTPITIPVQDVLWADWVPGETNTISYSRGEARPTSPGWQAFNDLWVMRIDPDTGEALNIEQVLPESFGGPFGWWGTQFAWSPEGNNLAWIRADSVGLVDFANQTLGEPLVQYAPWNTRRDWSWRTTVSWSPDGNLLTTTTHGPPIGSEDPEASPVFNVTVVASSGEFNADIVERAGIWSKPAFSPEVRDANEEFPVGYLAYLQAREWERSITVSEYDLIVADRDGSNARVVFPEAGQPGLGSQDFTWNPDGSEIAVIYQDNLWVIDRDSGVAFQLTLGGANHPVWTR